jgi:hypothetical protein
MLPIFSQSQAAMNRQVITYSKAKLKPEGQFRHSETERSQQLKSDLGSGKISQIRERSSAVTMRSPRTGKPTPCDSCGEIWISDDCCIGCGIGRGELRRGLEPISAILVRLELGGES